MKKLFALVALCVATVSASAQSEVGTFTLQPKIGLNFTNLSNVAPNYLPVGTLKPLEGGTSFTVGFTAGVEAEYQVTPMFSVAAGLLYSMQGTQYDDLETTYNDCTYGTKDSKIQLGYLNVPIVANVYVAKGFALKAGVQFGFLVNNAIKSTYYETGLPDEKIDKSYNDLYKEAIENGDMAKIKNFDFSIPLGASYEFNNVVIDARYNLGLTKVFEGKDKNSVKNQVVQVTVGYKFAL